MTSKPTERATDHAVVDDAPRFIDAKRRGFLQGTAVVGAAAVTGNVQAGDLPTVTEPELPAKAAGSRGYRLTDHVRKYYDRARF